MPSGVGGSYRCLADDVYKSTTVAENKFSVIESVKKAFNFAAPGSGRSDPLILRNDHHPQPTVVPTRDNRKMPTAGTPEETALLGKMPSDTMDDVELRNIALHFPGSRSLSRDDASVAEEVVTTARGTLLVAVQGNRTKPAILTYHDLGLNYISCFQAFFNYSDMRTLLENFCVYHVNAPGQEEGATPLPDDFVYPTMDELAEQLPFVLTHFGLKQVIGLGVGAGGNILARFALAHPELVEALCLINVVSTQAGWIEWGYQKMNARHLRSRGMTQGVLDYLMWHHFGRGTEERNHDLVQVYRSYFERQVNPTNLALFIDSYVRRADLKLQRELEPSRRKDNLTLQMPVINITGALSPHVDDTVTLNGRLDPTNSSWMKISDCGMVLEEQPGKVSEAFRLFLQGLGYAIRLSRKLSTSLSAEGVGRYISPANSYPAFCQRATSLDGLEVRPATATAAVAWARVNGNGGTSIHITENPISEAVAC